MVYTNHFWSGAWFLIAIPTLYLVGGLEHFLFFHILRIIIPTDVHIFQRGGPTTDQICMEKIFKVPVGSSVNPCLEIADIAGDLGILLGDLWQEEAMGAMALDTFNVCTMDVLAKDPALVCRL